MLTLGLALTGLACLAVGLHRYHRLAAHEALIERRVTSDLAHWHGGLQRRP
jgi:hypothetical protein